ncbi:hypothetical protein HPP92_002308 [Vanilla planifolia]|uniref:Uncharacterized protein n=1 Tax=Vanilla planifolia TaxID=51239 RepID=A0A835VG61_VANPL|nr:hypothetical protein HPP92_002308 [Vanilla planifolia]
MAARTKIGVEDEDDDDSGEDDEEKRTKRALRKTRTAISMESAARTEINGLC